MKIKSTILYTAICIVFVGILLYSCKKEEEPHPVDEFASSSDRDLPYAYMDWMRGLPDSIYLSRITIPGTHDCAADNHSGGVPSGSHWDVVCQDFCFPNQLKLGVRWFDVRYDNVDKRLHHGGFVLSRSLDDIIRDARDFLADYPSETVIFMIKKEYGGSSDGTFSNKVWDVLNNYDLDLFYLDEDQPFLGEVRGKIVIATHANSNRNGHPLGLSFAWDDNTVNYWGSGSNYDYYVQDHYSINNVDYNTKCNNIKDLMKICTNPVWSGFMLNFTSGERDWKATSIRTVASNINGNINDFMQTHIDWRNCGVIFLNYAGGADDGSCCPNLVRTIIQHNDFDRVYLGSQVWAGKDLDVTTYRNGDPIPKVQDTAQFRQLTSGAYYEDGFGKHYNWYAVNDNRGLAPAGWRIPTANDWDLLIKVASLYLPSANIAAKNLKESGSVHWEVNNGENPFLFTALPNDLKYMPVPVLFGYWWSATESDPENAIVYMMSMIEDDLKKENVSKNQGFCIRCIQE